MSYLHRTALGREGGREGGRDRRNVGRGREGGYMQYEGGKREETVFEMYVCQVESLSLTFPSSNCLTLSCISVFKSSGTYYESADIAYVYMYVH